MNQSDLQKRQFGLIAIKKGFATKAQIAQAIQEQKRQVEKGNRIRRAQ